MDRWVGVPGLAKGGLLFRNMPSLWRPFRKLPTKTENCFFRFRLPDLLNP